MFFDEHDNNTTVCALEVYNLIVPEMVSYFPLQSIRPTVGVCRIGWGRH